MIRTIELPRRLVLLLSVTICALPLGGRQEQATPTPNYFDQSPPGDVPILFAPGLFSTRYHEHSSPNFSPDMTEMFYTLSAEHGHIIMHSLFLDGAWSLPTAAAFSGRFSDDGHVFSADGTKLYFRSRRPLPDGEYRDWVVEKTETGWGEPRKNGFSVYTISLMDVHYFYQESKATSWDIHRSSPDDNHQSSERLGSAINSPGNDATPFVAADGEFLIFASSGRDDAIGEMDLYISFKEEDRSWSRAQNMGEPINKPGVVTRFPRISPDRMFLFYWSNLPNDPTQSSSPNSFERSLEKLDPWRPEDGRDGDVYWISTTILDRYRSKNRDR